MSDTVGMSPTLLVVDDSETYRRSISRALSPDFDVVTAGSPAEGRPLLKTHPRAVLLDLRLDEGDPENRLSMKFLEELQQEHPDIPVIMITAYGDVQTAVECMQAGAIDFIDKSSETLEIKTRIQKVLDEARIRRQWSEARSRLEVIEPRRIVGNSRPMRDVKDLIAAVASDAEITVLVSGETGTGKELVARAIHATGLRSGEPFVPVAVSTLPATTLEGELFGYEAGAFTDARRRHIGLIERAQGGVLFLDEIGELALELQVKLLRFLEERVITRLGGSEEISIDVQVVGATNVSLRNLIQEGQFREDLYYRLKVCEIHLPALKERSGDIDILVDHFLELFRKNRRGALPISKDARETLRNYSWPGNIRELRNALESALLSAGLKQHSRIELVDLPAEIRGFEPADEVSSGLIIGDSSTLEDLSLDLILARTEMRAINQALRQAKGKKSRASEMLGLNDRFVFSRRARRLCSRFPELAASFEHLIHAFGDAIETEEDLEDEKA